MPPFEYSPYRNPYVGSISELMMAGPQARARAMEQSGQAWGNAISNIGQVIGNLPAQIQQQKAQQQQEQVRAQQLALGKVQLEGAQRQASDVAAQDFAFSPYAAKEPGFQGPLEPGSAMPTRDQILDRLPGHMRSQVAKQFADADEADVKAKKAKSDAAAAEADYFGALAAGVQQWNYDPQATMLALQHAKAAGHDTSQIETMLKQRPDALKQVVDGLIAGSPKYSALARQDAQQQETVRHNQNLEFSTATTQTLAAADKKADNARADLAATETVRHNKAMEARPVAGATGTNDVKDTVAGMKAGTLPPLLPGRASKEYVALMAEAKRQDFDLATAATDWMATQKHISTLNGAQQTRMAQAITTAHDSLDVIQSLADQWKGGQFPILNRVNLAAAKNGVYGKDVASVAVRLEGQITDVVSELGQVYMGGNSPTDHALKLAEKNLKADWDQKVLTDMIKLARTNLQIRSNSMRNVGVAGASENNPYAPPQAPPATNSQPPPAAGVPGASDAYKAYMAGQKKP